MSLLALRLISLIYLFAVFLVHVLISAKRTIHPDYQYDFGGVLRLVVLTATITTLKNFSLPRWRRPIEQLRIGRVISF